VQQKAPDATPGQPLQQQQQQQPTAGQRRTITLANTVSALQIMADTLVRTSSELRGRCNIVCPAFTTASEPATTAVPAPPPDPRAQLLRNVYERLLQNAHIATHLRSVAQALLQGDVVATATVVETADGGVGGETSSYIARAPQACELQRSFFATDAELRDVGEMIGGLDATIQWCDAAIGARSTSPATAAAENMPAAAAAAFFGQFTCTPERVVELLRAMRTCADMHRAAIQAMSVNTNGVSLYPSNIDIYVIAEQLVRQRAMIAPRDTPPAAVRGMDAPPTATAATTQQQQSVPGYAVPQQQRLSLPPMLAHPDAYGTLPTVLNSLAVTQQQQQQQQQQQSAGKRPAVKR
jgi:hypothetical protein